MASKIDTAGLSFPIVKEKATVISSLRFDWTMVIVSVWWLGGLFIDGWAHSNIPQSGILWSVPFWAGAPVIAGITGFLLSYVMIPPAYPAEEKN